MSQADDLVLLQRFLDPDQAVEMAETLSKHGIESELDTNNPNVVGTFTANTANKEVLLMIYQRDLDRAKALLDSLADEEVVEGEITGHYLESFTVEELWEVVQKPDEWNPVDVALAKKLLKEKGEEASDEKIAGSQESRLEELAQPQPAHLALLIAGYLFAVVGGVFGIIIGLQLKRSTKELPNGEKVFFYTEANRKDGQRMVVISIAMIVFWNLVFLLRT